MAWLTMATGLATMLSAAPDTSAAPRPFPPERQILYLNPIHLSKGNVTVGLERFMGKQTAMRVTLSGGTRETYVFGSVGVNRHVGWPNPVSWVLGLSLFGYESPIETRVPISTPFNEFFESGQDQYYAGLYLTNGVLLRVGRKLFVTIDAAAGPARNISGKRWLAAWAINLNLGFPF